MESTALHITNGDDLTRKMKQLDLPGQVVVWREMLCEGPCIREVGSKEFLKLRKRFLKKYYKIPAEVYEEKFIPQLKALKSTENYDYVVLWFEFDLFCYINMLAAISYFMNHKEQKPFYLVCSKKLKGENEHQSLTQLNQKQLKNHYKHKIALTKEDLEIAVLIWELYCSNDPMQLKSQIKTTSNFEYLSGCIRAHIERFPNSRTGINSLERNVLKIIETQHISSENQLLGYALEYQGYYGFTDIQMQRLLNKISIFYTFVNNRIVLNEKGRAVYDGNKNFYRDLKNEDWLGGVKMYDFLYEADSHRLLKL